MKKKISISHSEWWILLYGHYKLKEPSYKEELEVEIDVDKAIKAESKAYEDLSFNQSLLCQYGYRERRLNHEAHISLRNKLNSL